MTILYLADIRFPIERANGIQTMQTCHALAARGHHVTLMVRGDIETPARDPFAFYGVRPDARLAVARRAPARGRSARARYVVGAVGAALRAGAGVILTRDLGTAALLLRLPRLLRPPLVYESHGYAPAVAGALPDLLGAGRPPSAAKLGRLAARERRVWAHAEGYVAITTALLGELVRRFGARPNVAHVPDAVRANPDARRFEGPGDCPIVGYAGHLYPWKGVDLLLDALALIPGVRGLIVGGHPAEPDLERCLRRAGTLGIADRVSFTGMVDPPRVPALLLKADVLVLPNPATPISVAYTSPLKLFEYMAAGRPIVASDLPAVREVIRHEDNGLLVEPGSAAALAAGIRRVIEHRALAAALAGRALAEAPQYSWSVRAERLEAVLALAAGAA